MQHYHFQLQVIIKIRLSYRIPVPLLSLQVMKVVPQGGYPTDNALCGKGQSHLRKDQEM